MRKQDDIRKLFPEYMSARFKWLSFVRESIQEIRLAVRRPARVLIGGEEFFIREDGTLIQTGEQSWQPSEKDIEDIINNICRYSLYAFENEIKQGFLTVQGGHRIGVAGQVVTDSLGQMKNITYIRFLNIRIAHEVIGAANSVIPFLYEKGDFQNCLIISPPGCGKTTLLRDIVRQVSNGTIYGQGLQIGIVDERSEIAGCYLGIPQNDIGIRTDVLDACPKIQGMMLLIRSMSPKIVAVDEIGSREDLKAMEEIAKCGGKILATMHGSTIWDVRTHLGEETEKTGVNSTLFQRYIFMKKKDGIPHVSKILNETFQEIVTGS